MNSLSSGLQYRNADDSESCSATLLLLHLQRKARPVRRTGALIKDEEENDGKKTVAGTLVPTTTEVAAAAMEDSIGG